MPGRGGDKKMVGSQSIKRIAVIGGGITGLSAAFYLQKACRDRGISAQISLFEAETRLGGKIDTEVHDGFVMEKGPDSFLAQKQAGVQFVKELGLKNDLVRNHTGQAYILHQGKLIPIPEGAVMGIPTRLSPFATTPLFSLAGKLRAAGDLFLPRHASDTDLSVGRFFRDRLGDEVVDHLIEPLLSGIYAGDIDQLSLQATFPQFAKMEQKYRSLILGLKQTRPRTKGKQKPLGMFLTLKKGLKSLVAALEQQLHDVNIQKGFRLRQIVPENPGYTMTFQDGQKDQADLIVMAVPHAAVEKAFPRHGFLQHRRDVPSTSVATVLLAYDEEAVHIPYEGTGFVVPRREPATITACTWTHKKWPHTAPKGKALLRCYVGRAGDDAIVDEPDDVIIKRVTKDLQRVMGISSSPIFSRITRWKQAMPQYIVGHADWLRSIEPQLRTRLPGVFLAGSSYRGIGLPDCIQQGKQAAEQVMQSLDIN
jgi:protoporphyrinogen/coproporphyrinogen III oxidase